MFATKTHEIDPELAIAFDETERDLLKKSLRLKGEFRAYTDVAKDAAAELNFQGQARFYQLAHDKLNQSEQLLKVAQIAPFTFNSTYSQEKPTHINLDCLENLAALNPRFSRD